MQDWQALLGNSGIGGRMPDLMARLQGRTAAPIPGQIPPATQAPGAQPPQSLWALPSILPTSREGWKSLQPQWQGGEWGNHQDFRDARHQWRDGFKDWRQDSWRGMFGQNRNPTRPPTPAGMTNALDALPTVRGLANVNPNSNFGRFFG